MPFSLGNKPSFSAKMLWNRGRAYRGADLAILRGHTVSVVQVCKGLGRPPGLQVPGHAHGGPHLGSIEGVARPEEVLGTPSFALGVGKKHYTWRAKGAHLLPTEPLQEVALD